MKKIFVLAILALVIFAAGCTQQAASANQTNQTASNPPETTQPQTASVSISGFAFDPATITISKGSTVTWVNNDAVAHTITGADFDSGTLDSGKSYSHKFDSAGTFEYHCAIHPSMKGTVVVQ